MNKTNFYLKEFINISRYHPLNYNLIKGKDISGNKKNIRIAFYDTDLYFDLRNYYKSISNI